MKRAMAIWGLAAWLCLGGGVHPARAAGMATIGESGEWVELSRHLDGRTIVDRIPLYRSGGVRYFSAGVGLEERAAEYPPFSLKIVLTAGGKPFLAGVAVTIRPSAGGSALVIPREQVDGPWLFVDVPPGRYDVTAVHGDTTQRFTGIKVEGGKQKTVHLRWAEDRAVPAGRPLE